MKPVSWPCPAVDGGTSDEFALVFDDGRVARLLVVPALFDEAHRLRRFTVEVMRRLDGAGIDSFLPDLPGTNESLAPLPAQTFQSWHNAIAAAARYFAATHVLAMRGGALLLQDDLPGWIYAPVKGASLLRQMLRARIVSAREAGREETVASLTELARRDGIELAGYPVSAQLFNDINASTALSHDRLMVVEQDMIGDSALWMRAEPGEDAAQADALAAVVAVGVKS